LIRVWKYADASERPAITAAIREIDRRLNSSPQVQGESREDKKRVLIELPLGLQIHVEFDKQLVSVAHLWHIKRRR
jgi:hypothetical protein